MRITYKAASKILAVSFAAGVSVGVQGCGLVPAVESIEKSEEALPDGCPVGSDAIETKPTGVCVWAIENVNENALLVGSECADDATVRCRFVDWCRIAGLRAEESACSEGVLQPGSCPGLPYGDFREGGRWINVTLPIGSVKCGDRDWLARERECYPVTPPNGCEGTYGEGYQTPSEPQLCCVAQDTSSGTGSGSGGGSGSGSGSSSGSGSGSGGN